MVIIDASVQMSEQKCVIVFGCRECDLPKNRPLRLEVLAVRVVSKLNSTKITQILQDVTNVIGTITSICSDRGSDIIRGVKDFQVQSPQTRHTYDTAHRIANFLQAILEKNAKWVKFREHVTQARRKMLAFARSRFQKKIFRKKTKILYLADRCPNRLANSEYVINLLS